jgi:hypothetical protein
MKLIGFNLSEEDIYQQGTKIPWLVHKPQALRQTTGKANSNTAIGKLSNILRGVKTDYKTLETVDAKKMVTAPPSDDDKLFTEKEVAKALNISIWTVRRWRLKANLPYIGDGRRYFYRLSSVRSWIKAQEGTMQA